MNSNDLSNENETPAQASATGVASTNCVDALGLSSTQLQITSVSSDTSLCTCTHHFSNELRSQRPACSVTASKSADNNNANEVGRKEPSRKGSLIRNLAKVHPFPFPSFTNSSKVSPTVKVNDATNTDEEKQSQPTEELCILKAVAALPPPDPEELPNTGSETRIPARHASIANLMIDDINRKENEVEGHETPEECNPIVIRCTESDSMEGFCRICHDNPSKMTLIAPCSCKGSMGLVHRTCLERWLGESGKQNCEICNTEFITERRPRYTGFSSVCQWIKNPLSPTDTRNLFFDFACFLVLTPLAAMSAWLCVVVIMQDAKGNNLLDLSGTGAATGHKRNRGFWRNEFPNDPDNTTWTAIGLLTLTGTLLAAYYVWLYVAVRYHVQIWREWQRHNYVVTIMPANPNRIRSNAAPASSSAADDPGHRSDPGPSTFGTNNSAESPGGSRARARYQSLPTTRRFSNRQRVQERRQGRAARIEAQTAAAAAEMDSIYHLEFLNDYHALLMASVNLEEDVASSSSSFSFPSSPSPYSSSSADSSGRKRKLPTQSKASPVLVSTVIDTPDREVTIIEPAMSLPNFSHGSKEETEISVVSQSSEASVTNDPEVACVSGGGNNNEATPSQTSQEQERPSSAVDT